MQIVDGSIVVRLGGVEVIQIDEITWTPSSPLHPPKVLKRAYCNCHVLHFDLDRPRSKLGVRQDTLKTLDHVQISELCSDQRSFAAAQQRRNGTLGTKQRLPHLDMTTELSRDAGQPIEVLRRRIGHDVAVLCSPYNAPRSQRQAADDDEANILLDEANEKLVERWRTQRARRAESRNSNSLRVSEIVSLRFTTSGLCPSARKRSFRTRSPSGSCDCCMGCSAMIQTLPSPSSLTRRERRAQTGRQLPSGGDGEGGTRCKPRSL
jgi:hypothetical protein